MRNTSLYLQLLSLRSSLEHSLGDGTANLPATSVMHGVENLIFNTRISMSLLVVALGCCSRTALGLAVSTVALVMTWVSFWRWENWIRADDWTGHGHAFNDLAGLGTVTTAALLTVMLVVIITRLKWTLSSSRQT
jgi:hypothetical protein